MAAKKKDFLSRPWTPEGMDFPNSGTLPPPSNTMARRRGGPLRAASQRAAMGPGTPESVATGFNTWVKERNPSGFDKFLASPNGRNFSKFVDGSMFKYGGTALFGLMAYGNARNSMERLKYRDVTGAALSGAMAAGSTYAAYRMWNLGQGQVVDHLRTAAKFIAR